MNSFLTKLLDISKNYFYVYPVLKKSVVERYNYGPTGELLRNNIFSEWFLSNVTCKNGNVFPFYSTDSKASFIDGIETQYSEAKRMSGSSSSFTIAFPRIPMKQDVIPGGLEESKYFRPQNITSLRSVTFTSPDEGRRYFHYWLRQRKMWWRKFSANPGRFSVTEIKNEDEHLESANIQASFPWGTEEVETVRSFSSSIFDSIDASKQELWKLKPGKKNVFPCVVESVTNLEIATMCFMCDSLVEDFRPGSEVPHKLIKLHRRLAPYKIAIVIDTSKNQQYEDMVHFAEYLVLTLKKSGISTLFLLKTDVNSLEEQFQYYDILAVPYIVVIQESTLSDGLFGLRCRETTLQERLHMDMITGYVEKLMKNY